MSSLLEDVAQTHRDGFLVKIGAFLDILLLDFTGQKRKAVKVSLVVSLPSTTTIIFTCEESCRVPLSCISSCILQCGCFLGLYQALIWSEHLCNFLSIKVLFFGILPYLDRYISLF